MRDRLEALTLFTASDVLVAEGMHKWPLVVMFNQLKSEVPAKVSSRNGVVALLQDLIADFDVVGYIELPSVVYQPIYFFPLYRSIGELTRSHLLHPFKGGNDFGFLLATFSNPSLNWVWTGNDCGHNLVELSWYQNNLITVIVSIRDFD